MIERQGISYLRSKINDEWVKEAVENREETLDKLVKEIDEFDWVDGVTSEKR